MLQHLFIVIGFQHQVIGLANSFSHSRSYLSHIGGQTEGDVALFDAISHTVAAVVRNLEWRDLKVANEHRLAFVQIAPAGFRHLRSRAIVVVDAYVHLLCGIDEFTVVVGQTANGLNVVGMVVGNEDAVNSLYRESIIAQRRLERSHWDAGIYEYTTFFALEVIAVPTTATPQA